MFKRILEALSKGGCTLPALEAQIGEHPGATLAWMLERGFIFVWFRSDGNQYRLTARGQRMLRTFRREHSS